VSSDEAFDALRDPCAETCVLTEVVMLRMRGRRIAMDAAIMPVPGSAVAQIVALMVIAKFLVSYDMEDVGELIYIVILLEAGSGLSGIPYA
jgi:hypothetical protein